MTAKHCSSCGRVTGHKRSLGAGTIIALVLTGGFWLFALPFYPQRCVVCGLSGAGTESNASSSRVVILLVVLLAIVYGYLSRAKKEVTQPQPQVVQQSHPAPTHAKKAVVK